MTWEEVARVDWRRQALKMRRNKEVKGIAYKKGLSVERKNDSWVFNE